MSKGPIGTGAQAPGSLYGAITFQTLVAAAYVWWYRRRTTPR